MLYSETRVVQQMIAIEPMKQDIHKPMSSEKVNYDLKERLKCQEKKKWWNYQ